MVIKKNQIQMLWERESNRIYLLTLQKIKDLIQATDFSLTKKNEIAR